MLIFSISFPDLIKISYLMDTHDERRFGGEERLKDRVTLQIILVFTLARLKTFTQGRVSVFNKYLHWPRVSVKHLNAIYTAIDTYMHNTG
jgi:hypothetical protein